jgi:hypothetical protein
MAPHELCERLGMCKKETTTLKRIPRPAAWLAKRAATHMPRGISTAKGQFIQISDVHLDLAVRVCFV